MTTRPGDARPFFLDFRCRYPVALRVSMCHNESIPAEIKATPMAMRAGRFVARFWSRLVLFRVHGTRFTLHTEGEVTGVGYAESAERGAERGESDRPERQAVIASLIGRQQPLPLPWQLVRTPAEYRDRDFAHPAELDFSRILTFYRIRWSYEPTTFPLAFSVEGRPSEMFTPDFYLPDHQLYIELTTMRQRLVTRKNRKIRRLRELYPNVQIKLLYRRDYDRLVDAYRQAAPSPAHCRVGRVLFDERQIAARIGQLADAIGTAAAIEPPVPPAAPVDLACSDRPVFAPLIIPGCPPPRFVPSPIEPRREPPIDRAAPLLILEVDRGSALFADSLTTALAAREVAIERDRVILTRHRTVRGERFVRVARAPGLPIAGRRIILVTDVVSTGLSLAYLTCWLKRRGALQIDICTMLDRRAARLVDVPVDYVGFDAPNELLVGFGLHLRRQFRDLPFIASVVAGPAEEIAGSI